MSKASKAYNQRYRERAAALRAVVEPPEGQAIWARFDDAVAACRRIEAKYGLNVWGYGLDEGDWPLEYISAVAEWDAARIERNKLYEVTK